MAITLRICQGGILVFYAKITTKLTKGSTIELQPVIRYEGVHHPKSCNNVPLHELFNVYILDISQCLRLCPFGEVIDSYQNKPSITHGLGKWAENVQPPLCKGLGAVDWVQITCWLVDQWGVLLALFTLSHILDGILLHL